ncbi:hypothetical protein EYF80_023890 [Liparis tanakae]|uniref:Uncharacterized protein n=1 Tax=Liparis tanakae TaxID=230148 RepID=A0A4Z2HJX0_9TELE|nr:hypothetical protein EYF80_023890 [Liparis tanakae]
MLFIHIGSHRFKARGVRSRPAIFISGLFATPTADRAKSNSLSVPPLASGALSPQLLNDSQDSCASRHLTALPALTSCPTISSLSGSDVFGMNKKGSDWSDQAQPLPRFGSVQVGVLRD